MVVRAIWLVSCVVLKGPKSFGDSSGLGPMSSDCRVIRLCGKCNYRPLNAYDVCLRETARIELQESRHEAVNDTH